MRRRPRGRRRSVDRGTCGPGIEPRNQTVRGADAVVRGGRQHARAPPSRGMRAAPRGRRPRARAEPLCARTGRSPRCPPRWCGGPRREGQRPNADDERPGEVGQARSTDEAAEQSRDRRRRRWWREGAWPRGTRASKTRPGHRAGPARPVRSTVYVKQQEGDRKAKFTALLHHVTVDRLREAYLGASSAKAAAGVDGVTWEQYGRGPRGRPRGSARTAAPRSVPSEAVAEGVHPEGGRAAATARHRRAGGQDRPASGRRGAERDLRGGLPRLLVRVSARAQPARCAGRARGRRSRGRR